MSASGPSLFYSKDFKGSVPAYVAITVEKSGNAIYKEAPADENPIRFHLSPAETEELFGLADKLDRFSRPLESGLKVAYTGMKTFGYEDENTKQQIKFNYSEVPDARTLADCFEQITETERDFIELDGAVHFDKLGVNKAVLQVQVTWEKKRLVSREQFLPLLDRIAQNESFLHMARERASNLAAEFRKEEASK